MPVPATRLVPSTGTERIELIDALRGFALAGVLLANLDPLSLYYFLDEAARAHLPTAGFDAWAVYATNLLVAGKFITLFSLLFGLSFSVQLERAQAKGAGLAPYLRRIAVLLLIGFLHTYLLWWGDILLVYALLAVALIAFLHVPDRWLLITGLVLALSWPLAKPLIEGLRPPGLAGEAQMYAASLAAFSSSSVADAFTQNIAFANWNRWASWGVLPFVFADFLLGYWAGRKRLLHDPLAHAALLRTLVLVGGLAGLVASIVAPRFEASSAAEGVGTLALQVVLQRLGPLGLGCAYAAGFALLFQRPAWQRWLRWLAPVGRMALTNYLIQTPVCLALFYGTGLGLGQAGGYPARYLAWAAIFAAQIAFSHWWLARFRFGPVEWVWRSATYGRAQLLRREPAILP
ncbi:DUF418 domain-containing protein [Lysobacter niabensis]|uniref:DUF418 domain-containing protein n=1 Tax=Agrilutibacter niabensis TaxID=380628 RepID=UPI00361C90BF